MLDSTKEIKLENPETTASELLISINNEDIPYPYRYLRLDVISTPRNEEPKVYYVGVDIDPEFEPKGFNLGGLIIEIYPFTWDSIQIGFKNPVQNIKQIEGWITRWLDVEDNNFKNNPEDVSQTGHSFKLVENLGDWWTLTADFGKAPADALFEFIELMIGQGMRHFLIQSGKSDA